MTRRSTARGTRLLVGAVAAATVACQGEATAPRPAAEVAVVFVDNAKQLITVRSGGGREPTGLTNVLPFAASDGKVAYFAPRVVDTLGGQGEVLDSGGLRLYHVADRRIDTLPVPQTGFTTAGAISPDGNSIVYVRVTAAGAYLVTVTLVTGRRDSLNLSGRVDQPAAEQAAFSTPIFSPDGDVVAFLLPNQIGLQLMLYEVPTKRVEVFPLRVPTTTLYAPLSGWPRWTRDGAIRFLVRVRATPTTPTDTLAVLKIFPREGDRPAEVAYAAHPPASFDMRAVDAYSFDASGTAVAFGMLTSDRVGLFLMREHSAEFEELVYEPGVAPTYPILVP